MTVIDALVVELGFDTKDLDKGRKTLTDFFSKIMQGSDKSGKAVTENAKKQTDAVTKLRNEMVGLVGLFVSGRGIKDFIKDMTLSNASLARFSDMIGISARELAQWRAGASLLGVNAAGIDSAFQGMTQEIQRFALTGQSSVLPWFRMLGLQFSDVNGKAKDAGEIFLELADRMQGMDHAKASTILAQMGISQDMIQVILQGRGAVEQMLDSQKQYAAQVARDAPAAQARLKAWNDLKNTLEGTALTVLTALTPAITFLANGLASLFKSHPDLGKAIIITVTTAILGLSAAVTIASLAAIPGMIVAAGGLTIAFGPLLLALAAIAGVITTVVMVSEHWHGIWSKIKSLGGSIAGMLGFAQTVPPPSKSASPSKSSAAPGASSAGGSPRDRAMAYFQSKGWTKAQAAGIVGNLVQESALKTNAIGDSGSAFGIAQWHPARQAAFARMFGHDIRSSTMDEQLAFVNSELTTGTERGAGQRLKGATSAADAGKIVSKFYERPAGGDIEAHIRSINAAQIFASAGQQGNTNTNTSTTNVGTVIIHTAATDAKGLADGFHKELAARNAMVQHSNSGAT